MIRQGICRIIQKWQCHETWQIRDKSSNLISDKLRNQQQIDNGDYFVINRARQCEKTTILKTFLGNEYLVLSISFEGFTYDVFLVKILFAKEFLNFCIPPWFMGIPE